MRAGVVVCLVLGAASFVVVGSPSAAHKGPSDATACHQWNVTGTWRTLQSNVYRVTWTFSQKGTTISGSAALTAAEASQGGYTGRVGHVTGSLVGDHLNVVVQWPVHTDGTVSRGRYVGTVTQAAGSEGGQVKNGQAWDLKNPSAKASWTGTGAAKCGGAGTSEPVRVDIRFHANSLPTRPPFDGGRCPSSTVASRVTGTIVAQVSEQGNTSGGGGVADTPHLSKCRVPVIKVAVDDIDLEVLTPGKVIRAVLSVHIDQEGVHRPGDCVVGTQGTITATYNDTSIAANSLPNHSVRIGPWQRPCTAHNHLITNNISAITADASSSTWVRVTIACKGEGTGFAPRNCLD